MSDSESDTVRVPRDNPLFSGDGPSAPQNPDRSADPLPCPFCGDQAKEVTCPWNRSEVAFTCPSVRCLVFGRHGVGDRRLSYGPRWASLHWWNKRTWQPNNTDA